ncbi:nucleotidyltransferase domain-containing protein [Candidatus Woesearchaeota archaeon]|nr:nucleotidyltransferase domain-containing protein [Candidatus Woesearchaeota archaeon]
MRNKDIKKRIVEFFFEYPTNRLRVRQIEREVKVPLPLAIRYAKELEKEGILKSTIISGVKLYSADRSSKVFLLEKKIFNLRSLYASGLVDYVIGEYGNPAMMVFGSYALGEDSEESDIDLYIETGQAVKIPEIYQKKLKRRIHILHYSGIRLVENRQLANNILNGIVLNSFVRIFK